MLTGKDLTKIKYVAVEVIRKDALRASAVECGLFMGITEKLDRDKVAHKFLILVTAKAQIRMYNLSMYDILTIDATDENSRYMTVFHQAASDQTAAQTLLEEITKNLEADNRLYVNDPANEIIDIDTYEDFPESVLTSDNITGSPASSKKLGDTSSSSSGTGGTTTTNTTTTTTTTTTKQEPTVFSIKRKGKLPAKDTMDAMKDKVLRLASGDFELKALPIPDCDKEDEDDKKTPMTSDYTGPLG